MTVAPGSEAPHTAAASAASAAPLAASERRNAPLYDVIVVGGGPSGATAADRLARAGRRVLLLDRGGRIKPCGGAVPPRLIRDFEIPDEQIVARARSARIIAPSGREVRMPIDGGYVGMVDREHFDEFLRERARASGADRQTGSFESIERLGDDADAPVLVRYRAAPADGEGPSVPAAARARIVIGADGARSRVARSEVPGGGEAPHVIAYHEIVRTPEGHDGASCDVVYDGRISPDFYGWVFPHGATTSVGMGTAAKGWSLRGATAALRSELGLKEAETIREEGAPIPLKPLKKWDNGRDVVLAGDAAGVVAPASGEGIYYAMLGGLYAAEAADDALLAGADARLRARALGQARKRFMREHGRVFWILGMMQRFWYSSDKRRERFVSMCADPDVQRLTWEAYMNKRLVRAGPRAHLRIFLKDTAHLLGLTRTWKTDP